jgi:hypothetical protein
LPTPQSRTTLSPRIEFALSPRNTLVARYQEVRVGLDNQGVGDFSLASRAYRETQSERTLQLTETAAISPRLINETRFQYLRSTDQASSASAAAVLNVVGAFIGGGSTIGSSGTLINNSELTNITTYTRGGHTFKWGARVRQAFLSDTSFRDFAGTYTFYTLDQYQKTIALQQAGYSGAQLTALGGGPTQFTLNLGTPLTRVRQTDVGAFVNDDLRLRPNLMINFGLRYEAQSNLGRLTDFAPRIGIAWGIGGGAGRPSKTVLRAGAGTFFDRIPLTTTLNSLRFDGATQQSYSIFNPTFYPAIPSAADLLANRQPQQLQPVFAGIQAPRLYQTSLSLERQVTSTARVTLNWISTRGVHLLNLRNINAPVDGVYPFPDRSTRFLTESAGFSRLNQIVTNVNIDQKKYFVFGYYALSYAKDNNEGQPANPYDLRAEWGPSSYGDIRHRMVFGTSVPLLWKFSATSFVAANSGVPYNITTGLDPASTGYPADRPALLQGIAASACQGGGLLYASELGCFALTPPPGTPRIGHNSARGSANANMTLRIARTWSFGGEGSSNAPPSSTHSPGPMNPGGHGGNDSAGTTTGRRYSLTLGASTLNALNHPNFAPPNGDLSSPYFGQARSLGGLIVMQHGGGASTYNRKIDLQLRFTF